MKVAAYTARIVLIIVCLFSVNYSAYASELSQKSDSIKLIITQLMRRHAPASQLGETMEEMGLALYTEEQYDSAIITLTHALKLLGNSENLKSLEHCATLIYCSYEHLEQYDSLLKWARKAQLISDLKPGDLHNNYCSIGYAFQLMKKMDSAEFYFRKCLEYRKLHHLHERTLEAFGNLQYLYENTSRFNLQYETILEKIQYCIEMKTPIDLADALYSKGQFLSRMNDSSAVTAYKEALHFSDSVGATFAQGKTLIGLGEIFNANRDEKRALGYFQKAEQICLANDHFKSLGYVYINMSESYYALGEYKKAEEMIEKAHKINIKSAYKHQEMYVYSAWAPILLKLNKIKQAEDAVITGIRIASKSDNKDILVRLYQTYIKVLLASDKMAPAEQALKDLMGICMQTGTDLHKELCLESELEIMHAKGDLAGENSVLKQLRELDKKLASAGMAENIDRIHYILELEANQRENDLLKKQTEAQESFIMQQRLSIVLFVIGIVGLSLLAFLLYQNRQKMNRYVEELEQRNQSILEHNDMKDILFKIISHDLRGPIGNMQPLIDLIRRSIQNKEYEDVSAVADVLLKQSKSAYITLTNLLHWTLSQRDEISIQMEPVNLVTSIDSVMEFLKIQADEKGILMDHSTQDAPKVLADKNMLETVIRNLISNAIKYTNNNGVVTIACERQSNKRVRISVIDTGMGMTEEQVARIFDRKLFTSKSGTHGEPGSGVGLKLCIELVKKMNSELKVITVQNQGSMFYFELNGAVE